MMVLPLYQQNTYKSQQNIGNPGLLFNKFFDGWRYKKQHCAPPRGNTESNNGNTSKSLLTLDLKNLDIDKHADALSLKQQYLTKFVETAPHAKYDDVTQLLNRQQKLAESRQGISLYLKSTSAFITGMGNTHPIENGMQWHHTLGVPYLPASSVKGVLRNWFEVWQDSKTGTAQINVAHLFGPKQGNQADESHTNESSQQQLHSQQSHSQQQAEVGKLIFLDALPAKFRLGIDIMTPHYGEWYGEGHQLTNPDVYKNNNAHNIVPAGWHSPVPIPYLVAKEMALSIHIMPHPSFPKSQWDECKQHLKKGLEEAFKTIGAGAKTAVGYGYFEKDTERTQQSAKAAKEAKAERQKKIAEQLKRQNNSLEENLLEDALKTITNQKSDLLNAIELVGKGYFKDNNMAVARVVKQKMQSSRKAPTKWREAPPTNSKKHKKPYERTQIILNALIGD